MKHYQKALDLIKTNYKHLGLSQKVTETFAKKVAKRVGEDETKIEAEVSDIEDELGLFQSFEDQIRTLKGKGDEKKPEDKPEDKKPEETKKPEEDQPEWVKELLNSNKVLTERINKMDEEKVQVTASTKLVALLAEKGVSKEYYEPFISGREFKNDDAELETFAEMLKGTEANYIQANKLQKLADASDTKQVSVFGKSPEGKPDDLNSAELAFLTAQNPNQKKD